MLCCALQSQPQVGHRNRAEVRNTRKQRMELPYSGERKRPRIGREETRKGGATKGLDSYRLRAWWVGEGVSALG